MGAENDAVAEAINRLVDEYRYQCLWFLRDDYYPTSPSQQLRVLEYIKRHGDRTAYRKAAAMQQWLSRNSSAPSAAS